MQHKIPYADVNGPLPVPHLFQWPGYSKKKTYTAIVPKDMEIKSGEFFSTGYGAVLKISKVLERRPAKGDWSKQPIHKNPDYIKLLAF